MAAEYDVREIGYIGSIWLGENTPPNIVGRTIQVVNLPNTIQQGGWDPDGPPSGQVPPVAVYFANKDGIDLNAFNRQLPSYFDGKNSYNTKRLTSSQINQIASVTKVSANYLKDLDVIYYQNTQGEDSLIPIQDATSWSVFKVDTDDNGNKVATYYLGGSDIQYLTNYVFLVSTEEVDLLKKYFIGVQSQETLFDPPVNVDPTEFISQFKPKRATVTPNVIDFRDFKPPVGDTKPLNGNIIKILKEVPFPKGPNHGDIHEDVIPIIAEADATREFINIIKNSPDQFYISSEEGDTEYTKLTEAITSAIASLQKRYVSGDLIVDKMLKSTDTVVTTTDDGGIILSTTP